MSCTVHNGVCDCELQEEKVTVEGLGVVTFPAGINEVQQTFQPVPDTTSFSPADIEAITKAQSVATAAIVDAYPPAEAARILQKFAGSLSGDPNFMPSLAVSVIKSEDFFQQRITTLPVPRISANSLAEKKKVLESIRNNPLSPQKTAKAPISLDTPKTLEEIKKALTDSGVKDEALMEISDKHDLIVQIKQKGYTVMEDIDPLANLASLLQEEEDYGKDVAAAVSDIYACPTGESSFEKFQPSELNVLTQQCCEPNLEPQETLEIPTPEEPVLMSEEDVINFVADIDNFSSKMGECSSARALASMHLEKLNRLKDEYYPLHFYMTERKNVMSKFDQIDFLNKDIEEKTKLSASTGDKKKRDAILAQIAESVKNKAEVEKEVSYVPILSDSEKAALVIKPGLGIFSLGYKSTEEFLDRRILYPSSDPNTTQFTNNGGLVPGSYSKYFQMVQTDTPFMKEIVEAFKNSKPPASMFDMFQFTDKLIPELLPFLQNPCGIYYSKFYNSFYSADRVDSLFSYSEQGYLTPKPASATLASPSGQEEAQNVKIDEEKSRYFLENYSSLEKARVEERIADLKKSQYFTDLSHTAKIEVFKMIDIQKYVTDFVGGLLSGRANDIKNIRASVDLEFKASVVFWDLLNKKIAEVEATIAEKEKCIAEQKAKLVEKYGTEEKPLARPPGNDPFGGSPTSPFSPGPVKNCYWKEYTKQLQSVSFMPIPDVLNLSKRLFRYYPVGLQIPVPPIPGVLPTLAMGIPDPQISIPFPILWTHLMTMTTPMGQFVLWLTYCAPFTVAPYLMYIDENMDFSFLTTPKGGIDIPAKSLKWKDGSIVSKALIERLPGLKVPMKSLPQVDNSANNKDADDKKGAIQELRQRIKGAIDNLNASPVLTQKRITKNTKLRKFKDKIKASLDLKNGKIDVNTAVQFLEELKKMVKEDVNDMIDFAPFSIPKTQGKRIGPFSAATEFGNLSEKAKSLAKNGAKVNNKKVDVEKIVNTKVIAFLDTKAGRNISKQLEEEITRINNLGLKVSDRNKKISEAIVSSWKKVMSKSMEKIKPKDLGFVEVPLSLAPMILPEPCQGNVGLEPMPPWMTLAISAMAGAMGSLSPQVESVAMNTTFASVSNTNNLPPGKELLFQLSMDLMKPLLSSLAVPFPGWPNSLSYPNSVSMVTQAAKDAINAAWKTKLRIAIGGIPPIKITPGMVKGIADPLVDAAIDILFAVLIQEFTNLVFPTPGGTKNVAPPTVGGNQNVARVEQNSSPSIKLLTALELIKAIFGSDLWDIQEQDIKAASVLVAKDALKKADSALSSITSVLDGIQKTNKSIKQTLASFSPPKPTPKNEPSIDIGAEIATAMFKSITAKLVSGDLPGLPYPAVLTASALGTPGFLGVTSVDPFRAIEKLPPYERLSLKNTPFVLFLDFIAATAQRYGGIGSDYVIPYFIPET